MWKLALLLAATACVLLALPFVSKRARAKKRSFLSLATILAASALVIGQSFTSPPARTVAIDDPRPIEVAGVDDPYASSASCKECHEEQFESWHASYHRTMTQVATPKTVIGDFDNVRVQVYGRELVLSKRDNEFWVTMCDPELPVSANSPMIERPVVMTTGSHHMQVYWYATGKDRRLGQLPFVWLKETNSWVPIHSIFLRPTQTRLGKAEGRWNRTCIKCHTTQGRPRIDPNQTPPVDTHVAEFGIACEACHGPGTSHVIAQRNESSRDGTSRAGQIVNPAKLDPQQSADVCGQCHGVWTAIDSREAINAATEGLSFRPGDRLSDTRHIFSSDQSPNRHIERHLAADPDFMRDRFWKDGMVRVSGREYNGLIRSACFEKGNMTCVSCHNLHPGPDVDSRDWANDQLAQHMESNAACIQCHDQYADPATLTDHSHHSVNSSGSLCYNCHMPHTTYGLLKAIRSHQISSPSAQETTELGRPNACNQCHIDKTLPWTASALHDWYGIARSDFTRDEQEYSSTLLAALKGDAGERALAAWSLGWLPALEASRSDWVEPILAQLLNDPYHAIRFLAHRSLKAQPGNGEFEFNFVGAEQHLAQRAARVLEKWRAQCDERTESRSLLIGPGGDLLTDELRGLLQQRDHRTVVLAE